MTSKTKTEQVRDANDEQFEREVRGLRSDTKYYFRAAARDTKGVVQYGSTMSFTTDDSAHDTEPEVTARNASGISDDSVLLHGTVDMNDYRNGLVFFVYGEDEDFVSEVESSFETYDDVNEHGVDLQKVLVDSDLDNSLTYQLRVTNLTADTKQYFTLCVEYENGDSNLLCGAVRSFTTAAQ